MTWMSTPSAAAAVKRNTGNPSIRFCGGEPLRRHPDVPALRGEQVDLLGPADVQPARGRQQRDRGVTLEAAPPVDGTRRHVRVDGIGIRDPNDALGAVRRPAGVAPLEPFEPDHPLPAPGELRRRSQPGSATTDHHHIGGSLDRSVSRSLAHETTVEPGRRPHGTQRVPTG